MRVIKMYSVTVNNCNFTGFQIPDKLCADCVKRTGLRSENHGAVVCHSIAERSEAMRITRSNQLLRRAYYE